MSDILSQEILLMFNFLSRYGGVVDLGEENYLMMGKTFPLLDLNPTLQLRTVVVQCNSMVSPQTEVIIAGMVQSTSGDHAERMLEPSSVVYWHVWLFV